MTKQEAIGASQTANVKSVMTVRAAAKNGPGVKRKLYIGLMKFLMGLSITITCGLVLFMIGYVLYRGVPNISWKLVSTSPSYLDDNIGILPDILNTLYIEYIKEYDKFTKVQKAYLEKNLNNFQSITQRVLDRLGYPPLAAKLRIGGVNVIEFMFHPDGSITGLKVIDSSGYAVLDDYSIELIEIAYKNYPKPQTSTKLRFNVQYRAY